ncbi:MAG: hypothetical protein ACOVT5_05540 [Armatimonadaceae bacterium]
MAGHNENDSRPEATASGEDAPPKLTSDAAPESTLTNPSADERVEIESNEASATISGTIEEQSSGKPDCANGPEGTVDGEPATEDSESDTTLRNGGPGCWSRGLLLIGSFFLAFVSAGTIFSGGGIGDIAVIVSMVLLLPMTITLFPGGLTLFFERLFAPDSQNVIRSEGNQTLGWLVYLLVALVGVFVRDRRWFWSVFGLWTLLLLTNIAGCRHIIMKEIEDGFGASPPKNRSR